MESVIKVQNLTKEFKIRTNKNVLTGLFRPRYKTVHAVKNISFTVNKGEAVAFLGPNGAGKTTTTKMLSGLIYPTAGNVNVLGYVPYRRDKEFLKRIGLVMGNKAGLHWDLTASQSYWLFKNIYKISDKAFNERLHLMSELMEVKDLLDIQVRRLSLGERMKMELIGSLLHSPEVLFLDEPTIGLDIIAKKNIREFLKNIQKKLQTTLILTSHDMDDVEEVCERVIVINKGEIAYDDSLASLVQEYEKARYVRFIFDKKPGYESLQKLGEIIERKNEVYVFKVEPNKLLDLISRVSAKADVIDLQISSVPLEEIIGAIFRKHDPKSTSNQ